MKKNNSLYKLGLSLFLGLGLFGSANAQVSVSSTGGTTSATYTTVNGAFTEINAGTHTGVITITVTANTTEPATPVPLLKSGTGSASFTRVLIKPSGNVVINSASAPVTNRSIIELVGADNVTINGDDPATSGDKNLTIQCVTSTTVGVGCIRLASNSTSGADGADGDTVMNCILIGPRSSGTATTVNYGIRFSNGSTATTTGAYKNLNTVIMNNEIKRCHYGLYLVGASTSYLNLGTKILNNTIGSSVSNDNIGFKGIYMTYTSNNSTAASDNAIISGNDIRVGNYTSGYSVTLSGIELSSYTAGTKIVQNNIHDIHQPSTTTSYGAYGIAIVSSSNTNGIIIVNNFIRDIRNGNTLLSSSTTGFSAGIPVGIYISSAGSNFVLNHNTIVMGTQISTSTTKTSLCLALGSTVRFSQIYNNIFINKHSSTNAYNVYSTNTASLATAEVNNNNYYVAYATAKIGFYNSAARQTLLNWQLATLKDHLSVNENTTFTSATDLHIAAATTTLCESGGASAAITAINADYDGDSRPGSSTYGFGTKPDIGADEFNGKVNYSCTTPSSGTTTITPATICFGEPVQLSIATASGTGITYQWQYSNDGSSYTNIPGALFPIWNITPTSNTYYRCLVTCVNGPVTVASVPKQVAYYHNVASTSGAQRCGPGKVNLNATASTGATLRWYDALTSGTLLGTGTTLTTPTISSSTDFYVAAGQATTDTKNINHENLATYDGYEPTSPFLGNYLSTKTQYLILASDLEKAGFVAGDINSLSMYVNYKYSIDYFENFTIKMAHTATSDLGGGFVTPTFSTVWGSTDYYTSGGNNTFTFSSAFTWDGSSNILVQMCFDNTSSGNYPDYDIIRVITTPYVSSYQTWDDNNDLCTVSYGDYGDYGDYMIPDFSLNGVVLCSGPRIPVTASVNPLPSATINPSTSPTAICELQTKTFTTTSVGNLQWRNATGHIAGETASSFTTGTAGAYRVIVTNPTTGCKDSSAAITLNVNPRPDVNLIPSTGIAICTDSSMLLTSTYVGTGLTFNWYKDNVLISGEGNDSLRISEAGDYVLEAISATCADTSDATTLSLYPLPSATAMVSDSISAICAGRPVELEAETVPLGYSYQWLLNGVEIFGANNQKYLASSIGDYKIRITDNNHCRNTSDSIEIVVSPLGTPSISPSEANICEGTEILLHGSGGAFAVHYKWESAGIILPDTTANLRVSTPGVYSVTVRDIYNCVASSTTSTVMVYPLPVKPTIVVTSSTLSTSLPYSSYQWYRNEKPLPSGTTRTIALSFDGLYSVKVTNAQDCINYSDTISIQNLSIVNTSTKESISIKLYPNPTNNIVHIEAPIVVDAILKDMQGRTIAEVKDASEINLEAFADGIYTISVLDKSGAILQMNKIVKQSH